MRLHPVIAILVTFLFSFQTTTTENSSIKRLTDAKELRDLKAILYAGNLKNWKGRHVDSLLLDIYYPTGATDNKKYPLLVFYHAGGFVAGSRFNVMTICDRFADEGFIAVGIDYRLGYDKVSGHDCKSDSASFNDAIYRAVQDGNAAMRYLVSNADSLHIDTNWIFVAGSSAGGEIAYTQAYWSDSVAKQYFPKSYALLGSIDSSGNRLSDNFKIKGVCSMWGAMAHADVLIDSGYRAVPSIIFKGQEDGGFPDSAGNFGHCKNMPYVYAGVAVYDMLRRQNAPSVFYFLPEADHSAYDNGFCVQQSSCFFHSIMQRRPYSGIYLRYNSSCPK